jgi:hypothetical protein
MLATILLMGLFACTDYTMNGVKQREPEILVHPIQINFGHLTSGLESGIESFSVINTGDGDLIISSPFIVSGNDRYTMGNEEMDFTIPAGELIDFFIGYTPETYESNGGYIEIVSNDPDEPTTSIFLEGYGDAPVMSISPTDFDYGDISIGCDNEERITIRNDGNMELTINSVSHMVTLPADIIMEFGSLPEPPWTLSPSQEVDFLISYIPQDIGLDESLVTITGNDPYTPEIDIYQYGTADVENWFSHQWFQEEIPVLDILWVVDNSGSMNSHQANLSANIGKFMLAFAAAAADYNMAVITTDNWMFSSIVTPYSFDPEGEIANLVVTGINGAGMEKGIEMAANSLGSAAAAGRGGLFFREDAKLIVIFVSDEPDYSSYGWASYLPFFDNIKAHGDFVPYGVIGDPPEGCASHTSAEYGEGYWDLIDIYGGSWYSICASDWGVQLQDLAGEVTGQMYFELEEAGPIESTISVRVNSQTSVDWTYDASLNAVIFNDGHVPVEGQTIIIEYAVWGCGE